MSCVVHTPLALIESRRRTSCTTGGPDTAETRAVTTTGWVADGTGGVCASWSTVGGAAARTAELLAPGVPKLFGIGKRNTVPKLRSHVWPIKTGMPEIHRA